MHKGKRMVINISNILRNISAIAILCAPIFVSTLANIGVSGMVRTLMMMVVCYGTLFFYLLKHPRKIPKEGIIFCIVIIFIYSLTIFVHPEYRASISDEMWKNIVSPYGGVVCLIAVRLFDDKDELSGILLAIAWISFIYYGIEAISAVRQGYWIVVEDGISKQVGYSMSFGYHMLFPTLFFGYIAIDRQKKIYFCLSIIGLLSVVMLGSRMASICAVAFWGMYLLLISGSKYGNIKRKIIYFGILILMGIVLFLSYEQILSMLGNVFERIGFSSRTISRILEGTLSDDAARDVLFLNSQNLIKKGGMFGNGFLADRYYLGSYCHNIFLELFIEFGYVGGGILLLLLLFVIVFMLIRCKNTSWRGLFLVFFCCSFLRLLVSYSLWIDNDFWIMLGIFFVFKEHSKKQNLYIAIKE